MSDSWRITTILDNRSQKVLPTAGSGTGATVVRGDRSLEKPILFATGETQRILNLLGEPTKLNPDLLEAIEYNKSYPLWLVSPSMEGTHSALIVGPEGSFSTTDGLVVEDALDSLENVTFRTPLSLMSNEDEALTSFVAETHVWGDSYIKESMKLFLNGKEIENVINSGDKFSGDMLDSEESNLYTSSSGEVAITFKEESAPSKGDILYVEFEVNLSEYYFILSAKGAGKQYLKGKVTVTDKANYVFELHFQNKNSFGKYNTNNESPIEFSLKPGYINGFGQNIDAFEVFKNHDFFVIHLDHSKYEDESGNIDFVNDTSFIDIKGGTKEISDVDFITGYEFFKMFRTYQADIFFDATLDENIGTIFAELRKTYHPYSRFLLPIRNIKAVDVAQETLPVNDRGFSYFWGWFEIQNPYSKRGSVIGNPMGEIARNYADSWTKSFGGLAVAWINENGVGGQLTSGRYIRSIYDPSEDLLKEMDEARINPVIYDPSFGAMIVSRRTSIAELSDYSFSDYSMVVDYILKNVTSQVLPYQIVKLNDNQHRNIVRTKTEAILQPMTVAPLNVVDSYYVRCDSTNNNDDAKEKEEFRLDIAIKVTPKSRTIVLTFINTPQSSTVEAMFE